MAQIFARTSGQETACAETALCAKCATPKNKVRFANPCGYAESSDDAPSGEWVDCSQNDALRCQNCGATSRGHAIAAEILSGIAGKQGLMTDKNGNPLKVGDRVYVLPDKYDVAGGPGYVRRFKGGKARVDDGRLEDDCLMTSESYTWSSWCTPQRLERI